MFHIEILLTDFSVALNYFEKIAVELYRTKVSTKTDKISGQMEAKK